MTTSSASRASAAGSVEGNSAEKPQPRMSRHKHNLITSNGRLVSPGRMRASKSDSSLSIPSLFSPSSEPEEPLPIAMMTTTQGGGGSRRAASAASTRTSSSSTAAVVETRYEAALRIRAASAGAAASSRRAAAAAARAEGAGGGWREARTSTTTAFSSSSKSSSGGSRRSSSSGGGGWREATSLWHAAVAVIGANDGGRLALWQALTEKDRTRSEGEGARWHRTAPKEAKEICEVLYDELRMQLAKVPPPAIDHTLVKRLFEAFSHFMINREGGRELLLPLLHVASQHAKLSKEEERELINKNCFADGNVAKRRWGNISALKSRITASNGGDPPPQEESQNANPIRNALATRLLGGKGFAGTVGQLLRSNSSSSSAQDAVIATPPPPMAPPSEASSTATAMSSLSTSSVRFDVSAAHQRLHNVPVPHDVVAARRGEPYYHKPTIDETPAQPVPKKTYTPATEEVRGKRRVGFTKYLDVPNGPQRTWSATRPWSEDTTTNKAINFFDEGEVD